MTCGNRAFGGLGGGYTSFGAKALYEAGRAFAHGVAQGSLSMAQGDSFKNGFASGALGSMGSSAFGAVGGKFAKSGFGMTSFGALSGGIGAELSGGDFWSGAGTGATVALLNHFAHQVEGNLQEKRAFKKKYSLDGISLADAQSGGGERQGLVPSALYLNVSGAAGLFVGGGRDFGYVLPLRGKDAFSLHRMSTQKNKAGFHGTLSINGGVSWYGGNMDDYSFKSLYEGKSTHLEFDYIIGLSGGWSPMVNKHRWFSIDAGIGAGYGFSGGEGQTKVEKISWQQKWFKHGMPIMFLGF